MDNIEKSPVVLSLCSGILGLERGIERAISQKLCVAAYSEIEAIAAYNLIEGMEKGVLDTAPIFSDIKEFPFRKFRGKVHGITGGYPCQPFSFAGERRGDKDERHLWPYISSGISATRPLWVFFENVTGHLSLGYEIVRMELQNMGYVVKEGIFSAAEVGASHRRERLFILGYANGEHKSISEWKQRQERELKKCGFNSLRPSFMGYSEGNNKSRYWFSKKGLSLTLRGSSAIMGDTTSEGLQGLFYLQEPKELTKSVFPARPGEQQRDYEKTRTIKSGMGCTINGYNFTTDILRMLGNGVVEQTAERAMNVLLNEMFL